MKKIILFACTITLLAFLAWWRWSSAESASPVTSTRSPSSESEAPSSINKTIAGHATPIQARAAHVPAKPELQKQLREIMDNANRPISFFGKVIDQDGNPIPDVKITFSIRYMKEVSPIGIIDTFNHPSKKTNSDGCFALTGEKGSLLVVKSLEKEGYESSPKAFDGTYWYWHDTNPYQPDPETPTLFRMWKKSGAEKLVKQQTMTRVPYDGTSIIFDLLTGKVASNGDMRLMLVRNPRQIVYGQRNYEWTLTVEAVDGGVIETQDEQMYRAPADGYQPKLVIHVPSNMVGWTDRKSVAFYIKSRSGKYYGSVQLDVQVGSDKPTTGLAFRSFINPSGSRNLEYDPLQNVAKP